MFCGMSSCWLATSLLFLTAPSLVVGNATVPAPIVVSSSEYWYIYLAALSPALLILLPGKGMTVDGPLSRYRLGHQLRTSESWFQLLGLNPGLSFPKAARPIRTSVVLSFEGKSSTSMPLPHGHSTIILILSWSRTLDTLGMANSALIR